MHPPLRMSLAPCHLLPRSSELLVAFPLAPGVGLRLLLACTHLLATPVFGAVELNVAGSLLAGHSARALAPAVLFAPGECRRSKENCGKQQRTRKCHQRAHWYSSLYKAWRSHSADRCSDYATTHKRAQQKRMSPVMHGAQEEPKLISHE